MIDSIHPIPRYQILDRIGGGGFATVYRALDTQTGETVALKVLREQYVESAEFRQRFRNEAQTIRALPDNPHIVKPRDYGETAKTCYLAMELLQGEDLDKVLARRGALPFNEVASIAVQVADALAVAHRHGMVHRDIKPQNIKITPTGLVKVMDFGIARATEGTHLTRAGALIGTPQYIAPEIWEGQTATARSDVYSLGVVLYEMIAGRAPFDGDTPAAVMRKHLQENPAPLGNIRRDTPPHLQWIVTQALAKRPQERYADASGLLDALQGRVPVKPATTTLTQAQGAAAGATPRPSLASVAKRPSGAFRTLGPAVARPTSAVLVGRGGDVTGYRFHLTARDTIIGRAQNCRIAVADPYVSTHHARIFQANRRYYLTDLNSRNGTYVNERLVHGTVLLDEGDQIRVGQCVFTFYSPRAVASGSSRHEIGSVGDEQLWAAASHAGIIVMPVIVPLLIWATYRQRSTFIEHQAKQALVYQVILAMVLVELALMPFIPIWLVWLVLVAGGVYAAVRCYQGVAFEYPIIGELFWQRRGP